MSLISFHLPALSIGMFQSKELDHMFHRHSFLPLYYSILLFFFQLKEKYKKGIYSKKERERDNISIYFWQLESFMSPLNKALKEKSPPFRRDLVLLRYALTLLLSQFSPDRLSLPIIWRVCSCLLHDELIQSHHMLPHSHH